VTEYAVFLPLSNAGRETNKILHTGSLGDEDDAPPSDTCIRQRQHVITLTLDGYK